MAKRKEPKHWTWPCARACVTPKGWCQSKDPTRPKIPGLQTCKDQGIMLVT